MSALAKLKPECCTARFSFPVLYDCVQKLSKICIKTAAADYLKSIFIRAANGQAQLSTTDTTHIMTIRLDCEISDNFACLIETENLKKLLDKFKKAQHVTLGIIDNSVIASLGGINVTIQAITDPEQFPKEPHYFETGLDEAASFMIDAETISKAFSKLQTCIDPKLKRDILEGVYFHPANDQQLAFVATDGWVMGVYEIAMPEGASAILHDNLMIPLASIKLFLSLFHNEKGQIRIALTDKGIGFYTQRFSLKSEVNNYATVSYDQIYNRDFDKSVRIYSKALKETFDHVTIVANEKKPFVTIHFSPDKFIVTWKNDNGTEITTEGFAETDIDFTIKFYRDRLFRVINHIPAVALISFTEDTAPIRIRDVDDDCITYFVMPYIEPRTKEAAK
ncbi:DNA polymerase III subunit beta family protein [Bartonella sp. LJL80]